MLPRQTAPGVEKQSTHGLRAHVDGQDVLVAHGTAG